MKVASSLGRGKKHTTKHGQERNEGIYQISKEACHTIKVPGQTLEDASKDRASILGLCFSHMIMEEETEKQRLLKMCKTRQTRTAPLLASLAVLSRPDGHRPGLSGGAGSHS